MVTWPGVRFATVNFVSPRMAASIGVAPPGVMPLSAALNAVVGSTVYPVLGVAALSYGVPALHDGLSSPEKNWSAAD